MRCERPSRFWIRANGNGGRRGRGRGVLRAGVFFLPLPHPEAVQAAEGLSEENLVALKAGSQVSLDLHVPTANPQDTDALTASYTEQLKARGISVVSGAPLTFRATIETGKSETVTYHAMGMGGNETANVAVQISRLALVENGKVLWENSARTGGASMLCAPQSRRNGSGRSRPRKPGVRDVFFPPHFLAGLCGATRGTRRLWLLEGDADGADSL